MRRSFLACLGLLLVPSAFGDPGHAGGVEHQMDIAFFVHGFGAEPGSYPMNESAPAIGTAPQTEACTDCSGDRSLEYNFTSNAIATETDIYAAGVGSFLFWVRPVEVAPGVGVPSQTEVAIHHRLFVTDVDGERLLGETWTNGTLDQATPKRFEGGYQPQLVHLEPGATFRWQVSLQTGAAYNPVAAPYGGDAANPISVTVPRIMPIGAFMLHAYGPDIATFVTNATVVFNFTLDTHGSFATTASLAIGALPTGVTARLMEGNASARPSIRVQPNDGVLVRLEVTGLPVGTHTLSVNATTLKAESAIINFTADVNVPPLPPHVKDTPSLGPVMMVVAALAAILGRPRRR